MKINTWHPLPGHFHLSVDFLHFKVAYMYHDDISSLRNIPVQVRYYTRDVVFWKELGGKLYRFNLPSSELGEVDWSVDQDGVVINHNNPAQTIELEPVSELELIFLYQ